MTTEAPAVATYELFIGGEWQPAAGGATYVRENPATEEPIGEFQAGEREDVNRAVAAAKRAHDDRTWRDMSGAERQARMSVMAGWLRAERERLLRVVTAEAGKPRFMAELDVDMAIDFLEYYGGTQRNVGGRTMANLRPDLFAYTVEEPAGVAAIMTPWNFPLLIAAQKCAPALAAGCPVVLKPAPETPLTALELARAAEAASLPVGVFNVVTDTRPGSPAGQALVTHPDVAVVSFTGSDATGSKVMAAAAASLKRIALECGGKCPNIVHRDADLDAAIEAAVLGIFFNTGQVCNAATRVFVHEAIADEFLAGFEEKTKLLRVGDPSDPDVMIGPLISSEQLERVSRYVQIGRDEGANLVFGGEPLKGGGLDRGHFFAPTLFEGVDQSMRIGREEIFGPVLAMSRYRELDRALEDANRTPYGLSGAIWTRDLDVAEQAIRALDVGMVWVNEFLAMFAEAPHGGYGRSGVGREMGPEAMREFQETKTVIRKFGPREMLLG